MNDAITVERAGEILGCSRRRVFQLLADGTLERAPRYGRRVRVYLASRRGRARPTEAAQRDEAPSVTRRVRPRRGAVVTFVMVRDSVRDVVVHLPSAGAGGDFVTLCGLAVDGDPLSVEVISEAAPGPVDCPTCGQIWRMIDRLRLHEDHFTRRALGGA